MSTFFGLSIASSGLRAYHASANTVANNISNVDTKGYSKQVTNLKANSALRNYTDYGTLSTGVSAESVTQLRSEYYDNKYWQYSGFKGEYDEKISYMQQIETYFQDDTTVKGFSTLYAEFFNNIDTLSQTPDDTSVRNQVISDAKNICSYFNTIASALKSVQEDLNEQTKSTVAEVNAIAQKIALLNDQINDVEIAGAHANDLRDERALLLDQLSSIVSVEVREMPVRNTNYPEMYTGATDFEVRINGLQLVDGNNYRQLECVARKYKVNQSDEEGLYDIQWADTKAQFDPCSSLSSGSLKALIQLRDGNNHENFAGKVKEVNGRVVTVSNPNQTSEETLNLPPEGVLTLGNRTFTYSAFTLQKTASGEMEYQFVINSDTSGLSSTVGRDASVGSAIDYKGIAYYQSQMNEFLRTFARKFNDIQESGVDLNGNAMNAFFVATSIQGDELGFTEYEEGKTSSKADNYYQLTAGNIAVATSSRLDPTIFATATKEEFEQGVANPQLVNELKKLQTDTILYRGSGGDEFLAYLISDVTVDTEEAELLSDNYNTIVSTVTKQRTSISGVDEDEEALDLMKFQNAYNLCSKVVQVMQEMYDRLITSTGV